MKHILFRENKSKMNAEQLDFYKAVDTDVINWIRYSHTNHGKLYLGKERKTRNNNLYETTEQKA